MKIKPEWILYGVAVAVGLMVLNRATGGGIFRGLGESIGRAPVDALGGVVYGAFDSATGLIGASDADCEAAKASGSTAGKIWACWPKDWF